MVKTRGYALAIFTVSLVSWTSATTNGISVPAQYLYTNDTSVMFIDVASGCIVKQWDGLDPEGIAGHPWVTTVSCGDNKAFTHSGVASKGSLRFFLQRGVLNVNGESLFTMGDSFWTVQGSSYNFTILSGFVYAVGCSMNFTEVENTTVRTSSFLAPHSRVYRSTDAVDNLAGAFNIHDSHIGNGTTNARDLIFSKGQTAVDPPMITVLNCAPDATRSYVWYHSHPAGALYIPYAGILCFETSNTYCTGPGYPRWTSPNLFYYEYFEKVQEETPEGPYADALVAMAFKNESESLDNFSCVSPVVFGVTNFDPDDVANQPNFVDAPEGRLNTWGIFREMTVRSTTVVPKTVTVLASM